jgi:hypothetical protein
VAYGPMYRLEQSCTLSAAQASPSHDGYKGSAVNLSIGLRPLIAVNRPFLLRCGNGRLSRMMREYQVRFCESCPMERFRRPG